MLTKTGHYKLSVCLSVHSLKCTWGAQRSQQWEHLHEKNTRGTGNWNQRMKYIIVDRYRVILTKTGTCTKKNTPQLEAVNKNSLWNGWQASCTVLTVNDEKLMSDQIYHKCTQMHYRQIINYPTSNTNTRSTLANITKHLFANMSKLRVWPCLPKHVCPCLPVWTGRKTSENLSKFVCKC
jgi:hypothetical protein